MKSFRSSSLHGCCTLDAQQSNVQREILMNVLLILSAEECLIVWQHKLC